MAQQIGRDATMVYSHGRRVQDAPLLSLDEFWRFPDTVELSDVVVAYPKLSAADHERLHRTPKSYLHRTPKS